MLEITRAVADEEAAGLPESVWAEIATAPWRLLMLDYDGTLAPFTRERMSARMPEASLDALDTILRDRRNRVAIVSGRPIEQLIQLTGGLPFHLVGEHGWEERMPNGLAISHAPGAWTDLRLALGRRAVRREGLQTRLERKRTALVLHLRGIEDADVLRRSARVARAWRLLAFGGGITVDRIDGGYEMRARGRGKDTAVRELLRGAPPETLAAYVGDDVTDEDAFRALRPRGITIRVGPRDRPTHAEWQIESPADVTRLLARWATLTEEVA